MLIDAHCHIGKSWLGWQRNEVAIEKLLNIYEKLRIDMFCLSSFQIIYDIETGNREIYDLKEKYPGKIIGFGIICPRDRKRARDEVKRCIDEYGFKGIKLHPSINNYMIDSNLVDPVLELACTKSLPVLIHSEQDEFSHPRMIGTIAERYPEIKIIIAHMGGDAWLESIEMAKKYKNIFMDTSGVSDEIYIIPSAIEIAGANRIVWGTDAPDLNIAVELAKITTLDLYSIISQKQKDLILGENIAGILNM